MTDIPESAAPETPPEPEDTHEAPVVSVVPAATPAPGPHRPSILFACGSNILDITSGAALSMRTLLSSLASYGFRAVALQGMVFDSPQGGEHVIAAGEMHKEKKLLRSVVMGVEHIIVRTEATYRPKMTCAEQEIFIRRFREELRARRPDMIILWGGLLLEMTMMREAREAGIPVVFYLVNGGYKNKETFQYVSTIVTDTKATAALYKERLGLSCNVVGKFIDPKLVVAQARNPEYITFINPSFEKGVNVFMPLAKLAQTQIPEAKFLVVQSRGRWSTALKVLGYKPEDFPNVRVVGHQKDMRKVYGVAKVLLLPSVWHESGARVIPEALLNSVPVLASNSGGSAELIGKAGRVFDLPESVKDKRNVRAPDDVVQPWIDEITRIVREPAYYGKLTAAAAEEAKYHDLRGNTQRFIKAVSPVVRESLKAAKLEAPAAAGAPTRAPSSEVRGQVGSELSKALQRKKAKERQKLRPRKKA